METIKEQFEKVFSFDNVPTMDQEVTFVVDFVKRFLLQKERYTHFFNYLDEEGIIQGIKTDNWRVTVSSAGVVIELNKEKTSLEINFGRLTFYFSNEYGCLALTNHMETILFLELGSEEDVLKAFCIFLAESIGSLNSSEPLSVMSYDSIEKFDDMFDCHLRYNKDTSICYWVNSLV